MENKNCYSYVNSCEVIQKGRRIWLPVSVVVVFRCLLLGLIVFSFVHTDKKHLRVESEGNIVNLADYDVTFSHLIHLIFILSTFIHEASIYLEPINNICLGIVSTKSLSYKGFVFVSSERFK